MSAELIDVFQGIITLEVSGRLTPGEFAAIHHKITPELHALGGARLLILARTFMGWSEDGDWQNLYFQTANDHLIQRMALVADVRWEQFAMLFTARGMRPFPIAYFPSGHEEDARAWLHSPGSL